MNPFDRARIEAMIARAKLTAACGNHYPTSEQWLAVFEDTQGLVIEPVDPDDYALGGGDALLQRGYNTILVRKDVGLAERAYLLAHELGHWYLDSPASTTGTTSTAFICEETGQTHGYAVVDGYGAWERQELQANVFARELLLPKPAARALWANGWRSRQIATKFQLPLEVVRQQLADALLLPDVAPVAPTATHPPSDAQGRAAQAPEKYVNVVAGPGTGKTTTLVHRVAHLISSGVPASKILVMTFTNRAAQELVERLTAANVPNASQIWAGTFHSFGLELLRKHHHHFELTPQIKIADLLQQVRMMVNELPTLELKHFFRLRNPYDWLPDVLRIIHRLKEELVFPDDYAAILRTLPAVDPEIDLEREDIITLYRAYEGVLRREGWVDYPDLLVRPVLKARDDRPSIAAFLEQYDHVLVDEYQDVNHVMIEFVKRIGSPLRHLWVVGDIRQAIHHWRGASIQSLLKFDEAYVRGHAASIRRYSLDINRRSSPEILRAIERAGIDHVLQSQVPLDPVSPSRSAVGVCPVLIYTEKGAQGSSIVAQIELCRVSGHAYGSQGIISSTNAQLDALAQDIVRAGIPVLHIGDLCQRAEVKEFLCLMQLLNQRIPGALVGLLRINDFSMPATDIDLLTSLSKLDAGLQRGGWLQQPLPGLSPKGQEVVQALNDLLGTSTRNSRPWAFVCDLMFEKSFGLDSLSDQSATAQIRRLALWQFLYAVRNSDGVGSQATLSKYLDREDFRRYIGQPSMDRSLPPEAAAIDAVRLMTVHSSKGLEFDVVHMANVDKSKFGAEATPRHDDEHKALLLPPEALNSTRQMRADGEAIERNNLLYVGVSRAKSRLNVYCGTDASKIPTPLCDPLIFTPSRGSAAALSAPTLLAHAPLSAPAAISFSALSGFISCPLQYHYAHELNLPPDQEQDISIRARRSVLAGLEYVYRDSVNPQTAFEQAWDERLLPTEVEDKTLVDHARIAFSRGTALLPDIDRYVPDTTASVNGQVITMPWMLRDTNGDLVWLRTGIGLSDVSSYVRPILLNLGGSRCDNISIHSLVAGRSESTTPSSRPSMTSVFKAITALRAGERSASRGKHCNRCAYSSICGQRF